MAANTTEKYDTLYLSPHLDDAVLSCGGQIYQQSQAGERVLLVTPAAGEPQTERFSIFAEFQHHNWGLGPQEVVAARRAEDAAACRHLGAEYIHWHLPDAIYRGDPESGEALYTSEEAIFGPLHPAEASLVAALAGWMAELPPATRVVAPLTVGNHVDHQLTRAAAEQAFGPELLFYEDYPYAQRHPEALASLVEPPTAWEAIVIPLDKAAVEAKIEAIRFYESQLRMLFNDPANMAERVLAYAEMAGGERLWRSRLDY